jgi:hypothetical protein
MGGFSGNVVPEVIVARQTTALSNTGNTNENALLTVTIPPLQANSVIEVSTLWSYTNNSNVKTLRARLGGIGGTAVFSTAPQTNTSFIDMNRRTVNRNATNSQITQAALSTGGGTTGAAVTSAIETASGTTLVITAQCANAADIITLEYAIVKIIY